jgi:hypothetical protein
VLHGTFTSTTPADAFTAMYPRRVGMVIDAVRRLPNFDLTVNVSNPGEVGCTPITPQTTPTIALVPHSCEYVPGKQSGRLSREKTCQCAPHAMQKE